MSSVCGNPAGFGTGQLTKFFKNWAAEADLLPRSTNAEQEFIHWERWTEAAARAQDDTLAAFAAAAREDPVVGRLLAAVFGNSPFLSHCLISDQGFARELLQSGPDEALSRTMAVTADRSSLGRENVEQAKRRLREAGLPE